MRARQRGRAAFGALFWACGVAAAGALAAGCSGSGGSGGALASTSAAVTSGSSTAPGSSSGGGTPILAQGTFSALTYNVAGLPQGISSSNPIANTPLISPKLNAYDLVLVQEDFTYHTELARSALHPHQSLPLTQFSTFVNDGLNRFSQFPFVDFERRKWSSCYGYWSNSNDCLSSKGFSAARHEVAPGVVVDVYNLHADAGGDGGDQAARAAQFQQLSAFMNTYSSSNPVIVCGDTNLRKSRGADAQVLADFLTAQQLEDVAVVLGPGLPDKIDRFLFRSSPDVVLTPVRWRIADEMVDSAGNPLSDHEAIHVDFDYRRIR
ncbi:MAG: hypothetical protein D6731_14790 [Planctomycetota bacterium]|nr:MAG: hypothetical protein D6731_14790 [Planctomycetota bacterium]